MMSIHNVLCPVDFSECSRHALHHAVAIAKWYRAAIRVLHVYYVVPVATTVEMVPAMPLTFEARQELLAAMQQFAESESAGTVPATFEVAQGSPAGEIVASARATGADLIVVGTHGRSGFERFILGSVTERLLRLAPCPVLTVPKRSSDAVPVPPLFKRILCAIDFSPCSIRALEYATSLAQEADACLTVLHVFELQGAMPKNWRDTLTPASLRRELLAIETERRERLSRAVPESVSQYCSVETMMTSGTPYREILRLASERQAELMVIGVHGRNPLDLAVFGSTTNHVVRQATCPVLTIRGE
jgi:nucleotide-binding universal stress UspA family protein